MPTRTATLDWVPDCNPAIRPKVVMAPEVMPNPHPFHARAHHTFPLEEMKDTIYSDINLATAGNILHKED
jgi:hypothetical protein